MSFIIGPASQITAVPVPAGQGGTGLATPGTSGNVLTSNGSAWVSSSPASGFSTMQIFTSSGTFTIPAGKKVVKATVIGAGAGGEGQGAPSYATNGGNSSISSGTQTITTVTATGGLTANNTSGYWASCGVGGSASNGDLNFVGSGGGGGYPSAYVNAGFGGGSLYGGITPAVYQTSGRNAGNYGSGGSGGTGGNGGGGGGGGGGAAIKYLTNLTSGNTITVTIGAKGTGGASATGSGGDGSNGVVIFEY